MLNHIGLIRLIEEIASVAGFLMDEVPQLLGGVISGSDKIILKLLKI